MPCEQSWRAARFNNQNSRFVFDRRQMTRLGVLARRLILFTYACARVLCLQELNGHIHEIKMKADQSEAMVQEICRDIKKLDYAKKHLTSTITSLRRLGMLGELPPLGRQASRVSLTRTVFAIAAHK